MTLLDLINSFRAGQSSPTPSPPQGSQFLEGLMTGSGGTPPGFDRTFPTVMGMEGSKYYPEFRFGYSGTPALERLGVVQPGGMPPGLAMQIAQSQYFKPGSGQGVNLAGAKAPPAPAPAGGPSTYDLYALKARTGLLGPLGKADLTKMADDGLTQQQIAGIRSDANDWWYRNRASNR